MPIPSQREDGDLPPGIQIGQRFFTRGSPNGAGPTGLVAELSPGIHPGLKPRAINNTRLKPGSKKHICVNIYLYLIQPAIRYCDIWKQS
jgi:hypothetical protein